MFSAGISEKFVSTLFDMEGRSYPPSDFLFINSVKNASDPQNFVTLP